MPECINIIDVVGKFADVSAVSHFYSLGNGDYYGAPANT